MIGKTAIRPNQLTSMSTPWRSAVLGEHQHRHLARREHARAPSAAAARSASRRGAARGSSAGRRPGRASRPSGCTGRSPGRRTRRGSRRRRSPRRAARRRGGSPSPIERQDEEDRDRGEAQVADDVRDRPRAQRLAGAVCRRRRGRSGRGPSSRLTVSRAGGGPRRHYSSPSSSASASAAAPSALQPASRRCPRRTWASTTPSARPRVPTTSRSGQPSSSASVELLPRAGVAVVVEDLDPGVAQLLVDAVRRLAARARRPWRARRGGPARARSSAARRSRSRRRPARSPRRRSGPGRSRSCPSRSAAPCRPRRGRWRRAAPSSGCRA